MPGRTISLAAKWLVRAVFTDQDASATGVVFGFLLFFIVTLMRGMLRQRKAAG